MGKKSASAAGQIPNNRTEAVSAETGKTETVASNPAPPGHGHGHPHIEFKFFEELKHRNVVRVAILYLVACWLILEPTHVVFHMLEVPAWANRLVLILMAIGLPAVMLFAWAFEITPEGLKPTVEVDPRKSIRTLTGRRLDRAIIVVLVLALGYFIADKFWLAKRDTAEEQGKTAPAYQPPAFSVAVLSFTPPGGTLADQQLADVVIQGITNALGRDMHYATIVSRQLAPAEAGKPIDPRAIGRERNVRYLLEGDVHIDGNRVNVTTKLVDAESATQLWSDQFNAARSKWVADSAEASWPLISGLRGALWSAEEQRVAHGPGGSASAWDLVLRGHILERNRSLEGLLEARKLYDQAVRLDPTFTAALVDRAYINYRIWEDDPSADRLQLAQEMDEFARRALAIDKADPDAWHVRAAALQMQWRWDAALEATAQAMRLEPWSTDVTTRSWILDLSGHADEALTVIDKAIALDPSAALSRFMRDNQCYAYLLLGQFDKAIASCEKSVAVGDDWWPYMFLTAAYAQTGDTAKAAASKSELLRRRPGFSIARFKALALSDNPVYLQQSETNFIPGLRKAGIPEH
jgi:TolB-like protein